VSDKLHASADFTVWERATFIDGITALRCHKDSMFSLPIVYDGNTRRITKSSAVSLREACNRMTSRCTMASYRRRVERVLDFSFPIDMYLRCVLHY